MTSVLAILATLVALGAAGNVDYDRCGGVGTPMGLRIDNCLGRICHMDPGSPYLCETDFYPSSAIPSLSLRVTATVFGNPLVIIETALPNSGVQPGFLYTIKFTVVPNDLLAGEYLPIDAEIHATDGGLVQVCMGFHARVNFVPTPRP